MLQLLQQRTKLSGQIGKMKRRHGAVIYVPERERELIARLTRLSKGRPSARAVAAIYREILSSSRCAQGQPPLGLLQASVATVLPASRWRFGACDQFAPKKSWAELARGLEKGDLSLALLTGEDLLKVLQVSRQRTGFLSRLTVAGDFFPTTDSTTPLAQRVFIITPRGKGALAEAGRILILIECKSTQNAIKSLLRSMPDLPIQAEHLTLRAANARRTPALALVRLSLTQPADRTGVTGRLLAAAKALNIAISILGIYPDTEAYGG